MEKEVGPALAVLKNIRLTPAERATMLTHILSTPAPQRFSLLFSMKQLAAVCAAFVLVAGSGITYAAESSLPGDVLYPVKDVTERLRGTLAVNAKAKAEWHSTLALRRLEEGETLAAQGRLTAETEAELTERFRGHADEVAQDIALLADTDESESAATLGADFEATLSAHEALLQRIARSRDGEDGRMESLIAEVRGKAKHTNEARTRMQKKVLAAIDTRGTLKKATESTIVTTRKRIDEARTFLSQSSSAPALAGEMAVKLGRAEDGVKKGQVQIDAGAVGSALDQVSSALAVAEEARITLKQMKQEDKRGKKENKEDKKQNAALRAQAEAGVSLAAKKIADVKALLETRKASLTEEEVRLATIQLRLAETALLNARARLDALSYSEARTIADEAVGFAKKAKTIILRTSKDTDDDSDDEQAQSSVTEQSSSPAPQESSSLIASAAVSASAQVSAGATASVGANPEGSVQSAVNGLLP
ncbi:hypothetical protein HZA45_01850 [Candidatus Peregrinibacteria bacterium]|nr:hypothetical protein [Candidatus Peregrinibacteria bacterium]